MSALINKIRAPYNKGYIINSKFVFSRKRKYLWSLRGHFDQTQINWNELSELYRIAPLGTKLPDHLKLVFSNSKFKCFVYHENVLVGAGRGLADGKDTSYLCDIAVHPEYQGHGLGKEIVQNLVRTL